MNSALSPEQLMRVAIEVARDGMAAGQSPFGCAIAIGDSVVASAHNTVALATDVTAHAEINALRAANRAAADLHLPGSIVATTCEPCPMCMAALHWARVDAVYFGASIADAQRAGFNELSLSAEQLLKMGGSSVRLIGGVLEEECRELFDRWLLNPDRVLY